MGLYPKWLASHLGSSHVFFFKSKISFQEPSNEQRNSKGKKAPKSPHIVTSKSPEGNHND